MARGVILSGPHISLLLFYGYGYDDNGNLNVIKYYDLDGNATLNSSGFSSLEREYDDEGNMTSEKYYDLEHDLING